MDINPIEYLFKLNALGSVKFMSIRNYTNKQGEISNYTLIAAFEYAKAVQKDIKRLQAVSYEGLKEIARRELLESFLKNQNDDTRSAQSQAQIDAYVKLGANSRVHIDTKTILVWAFVRKKVVLVKGEYKSVNHQAKTIQKDLIKKELRLSTDRFRQFKLEKITSSAMQGETLEIFA